MRETLDWAAIESRRGHPDWSRYDAWVAATARVGLRVLPVLFDPPPWASKRPHRHALRGTYPPRSNKRFGSFAAAAARRYGRGGSFWRAHPELPARPIVSWQVWNEPNLPVYWRPRPRASQYVALLRATSKAIKRVDRHADIVTAGLPKSRIHGAISLSTFVRQIYHARGRSAFDTLAVNPYARSPGGVLGFLRSMRRLMNGQHDHAARLWATEIGWSDNGPGSTFRLGPKRQAATIGTTLRKLWSARRSLRLQGIVYFNWRDATPYPGGHDFWGLHTGLLRLDGRPKPALAAFSRAVAGLR